MRILSRLLMFLLVPCTWAQTAAIPSLVVTTPATTPTAPVAIQCPKNGGKVQVTLQPNNIPALSIHIAGYSAPVTLSGTNMNFSCTGGTPQADGSITGMICTVTVVKK